MLRLFKLNDKKIYNFLTSAVQSNEKKIFNSQIWSEEKQINVLNRNIL